MMRTLRDNTAVILWILVLAFVGTIVFSWGMGGFDTIAGDSKSLVAKVNGQEIEYQEYERLITNRLQQQGGDQADNQQVLNARRQSWSDLVNLSLEREMAKRMKLGSSDLEISDRIMYMPPAWVTMDSNLQTAGGFDTLKWHDLLRGGNLKDWMLGMEEQERQSLPIMKLRTRLMSTALVSDANLMDDHLQRSQAALGNWLAFPYARFTVDSTEISEAELQTWYNGHKKDYEVEERREIQYVRLEVLPSHEDSLDANDQMEYVRALLAKGETFENLARIYSMDESNAEQGGDLGWVGRGRMVPEFENAMYAGEVGSIVGPVITRFGSHLIKIVGREMRDNGAGVKEEQVQSSHILIKIEPSSMTHSDLRAKADALYEDALNGGDFEVLCAERQLKIESGKPFTDKASVPGVGRSQRATDLIFQAEAGSVIPPIYADRAGWFVIRVKEVLPKGVETLKDRRREIVEAVRKEKQKALALKSATDYLAATPPATLDSAMVLPPNAEFGKLDQPIRINQFVRGNVGRDLAFSATLFSTPVGSLSKPVTGERGVYILQCTQRDQADTLLQQLQTELPMRRAEALGTAKNAIYGAWSTWAREQAVVEDQRSKFGIDY